jgi:hypothetical protein
MERQELAAMAMHAILTNQGLRKAEEVVDLAVKYADALLYRLGTEDPHKKIIDSYHENKGSDT